MKKFLLLAVVTVLCCGAARAQTPISALPSATPGSTDAVPFVTMTTTPKVTKKTTIADFFSVLTPSMIGTGSKQGNGTKFQLFTGSAASGDCAKFDASGNLVTNGGTCAAAAPVQSVFGRTGAVVAAANDYNFNQLAGALACSQHPALTGDVTTSAGSCATTLANSGVTAATYTAATVTVDAKGRVTAASSNTIPVANSSSEAVLGANFQITAANGTYQDTGLSLSIPAAGTYLVTVNARFNMQTSTTTAGFITAKLFDATNAADIANSERMLFLVEGITNQRQGTSVVTSVVTTTGAITLKLYAKRDSGSWTNSFLNSNSDGRTTMSYVRLN